ncbi:centromere protein H [Notothenia coriiceps]|uniref:Centromere protein H n=1 Tax=Notothenia coriiceps TaxID=8208 RepID=A0A6I9MSZ7_9TELE|nr:PREDICTED: centromere protein H [Notothenia coriiceps]
MDPSDGKRNLNLMVEAVNPAAESSNAQKDTPPADMLRMNQQMSDQCFEMAVHLQAGKSKRSCRISEAERDLPVYVKEQEEVKTLNFNSTLTLHRMQMWHAIGETVKLDYSEAVALKAGTDRCMALCSQIKQVQQESKELQDEVTEVRKKRLGVKRLIDEKMKEMEDLKSKKEHGITEKYKAALEKGQENLEKYRKMSVMTQNVLRGIILACKVNWMEDPKLRDITMTLEDLPFSD